MQPNLRCVYTTAIVRAIKSHTLICELKKKNVFVPLVLATKKLFLRVDVHHTVCWDLFTNYISINLVENFFNCVFASAVSLEKLARYSKEEIKLLQKTYYSEIPLILRLKSTSSPLPLKRKKY